MEVLQVLIMHSTYRDSVFLMKISSKVAALNGINESSAMMGTERNKDLFIKSGLSNDDVQKALPDDLVIAIRGESEEAVTSAMDVVKKMLSEEPEKETYDSNTKQIKRLEHALSSIKDANVLMISVAGDYAKYEAAKGLNQGLNIMLYSDNISIDDELALKKLAHSKGLLVMGPDCGTSIIQSTPLAFANSVRKGNIGIVGASGTGIQECSSIIHRLGGGISQAIGTGGRDPKEVIGGITMMDALELLDADEESKVILIISKPPCKKVEDKIADFIKKTQKLVVVNFAGETDYCSIQNAGGFGCFSLREAAFKALELSGVNIESNESYEQDFSIYDACLTNIACSQKYLRGIYSGGSLCYEAMSIFSKQYPDSTYSNTPIHGLKKITNVKISIENTFLDMGEDEFTVGKPHPMIDPTEKVRRLHKEMLDDEVAIVLTDCVIGYGSHNDPAGLIAAEVVKASDELTQKGHNVIVVASVCGTEDDPQSYSTQVEKLKDAGVIIADSNEQAAQISLYMMSKLNERRIEK